MNSCGPVNQKPSVDLSKQSKTMCDPQIQTEVGASPSPSGTPVVSFSRDQQFIVSALIADVDSGQAPNDKPSPMTDNLYFIRFVNGHNLSSPSANAQLTVECIHNLSMGPPDIQVPEVTRQGDHFATTIHYGQSGSYELHLHLTDGAIQDDHVVYVNP
jgi:hypothetical protein